MIVELRRHTPDPEKALAQAFSECYQKPANIDVVRRNLHHQSVLEHVSYTFHLKISRVCLEQLVRHRVASFTVQSHRYTDIPEEDCYWYIPDEVKRMGDEAVLQWIADAQEIWDIYQKWRHLGVKKESARYLAPKGVGIQLTVTMNLRELLHFFSLRLDSHAQEEIRKLAANMYLLVMQTLPNLRPAMDEIILKECRPAAGTNPMTGDFIVDDIKIIPFQENVEIAKNNHGFEATEKDHE